MDEMYHEIIVFAELEEFQNQPFNQLSSDMKSRLAFSVAGLELPDIFIAKCAVWGNVRLYIGFIKIAALVHYLIS